MGSSILCNDVVVLRRAEAGKIGLEDREEKMEEEPPPTSDRGDTQDGRVICSCVG